MSPKAPLDAFCGKVRRKRKRSTGASRSTWYGILPRGKPVLTAVDLRTHYVVMMEAAKDRAGETWKAALEKQKTRGLSPETCVSDGGTGLLKGVPGAFPDIEMQADAFHALRDIGRHIQSAERKSLSLFRRLEHLEEKLRKPKAKEEERKQYAELLTEWESELERTERLDILFSWLREYTGFSGYGYAKSLWLCQWILEEMAALSPGEDDFLKAVRRFEKRLPALLGFLRRLEKKAREAALSPALSNSFIIKALTATRRKSIASWKRSSFRSLGNGFLRPATRFPLSCVPYSAPAA